MRVSHTAFQATELSPAPGLTIEAEQGPRTPPDARTVGVVFVHGIGVQKPAETFLAWSAPIVRMLAAWRAERGHDADPVVRAQFAFDGGALPYLELDVPGHEGREPARWILTEALWAEAIRPPELGEATAYLRDRLRTIVAGIRDGHRPREGNWDRRMAAASDAAHPTDEPWRLARLAEIDSPRWRWIGTVDWLQRSLLTQAFVVAPIIVLGHVLLALWAPLRRLPIGPLRELGDAALVDGFLTDWFGDLPVLLDDPVQAANVRSRVAEAVRALRAKGCDGIVLVAHSGGAIVSFETLLDPAFRDDPERAIAVDKLVTLGQGLNLAWRLEDAYRTPLEAGHRLAGDLGAARPELRWIDVWSSFDPAPSGPLQPPDRVALDVLPPGEYGRPGRESPNGRLAVESRPVTNRMSLREDHGAYWDNDEGFLVALLRHLDDPRGDGSASRFYRDSALRTVRIERRRQRVAVLATWRWLVTAAALVAIVGGGIASRAPQVAGETLVLIWDRVPGGELVESPLAAVWGALGMLLSFAGFGDAAAALPAVGTILLGAAVIAGLYYSLALVGGAAWSRWDARERALARLERLPRADRDGPITFGVALLVGLIGIIATALTAGDPTRTVLVTAATIGCVAVVLVLGRLALLARRSAGVEMAARGEARAD